MKLSEYDYNLPKELIAQYPLREREKCRLMVLDRAGHTISHSTFEGITAYFKEGDCLILNDPEIFFDFVQKENSLLLVNLAH